MPPVRRTLDVLERTPDRLVIQESQRYLVGSALTAFGIAAAAAAAVQPANSTAARIVVIGLALVFSVCFGLRVLTRSTITVDRKSGELCVCRRLMGLQAREALLVRRR